MGTFWVVTTILNILFLYLEGNTTIEIFSAIVKSGNMGIWEFLE